MMVIAIDLCDAIAHIHFLIEHIVSLWLEIAYNNTHTSHIFNELLQFSFCKENMFIH